MWERPDSFSKVNAQLEQTAEAIQIASNLITNSNLLYLTAKADYEKEYASALLQAKAEDGKLTQEEIKATAVNKAYEKKMEMIRAKSRYDANRCELRSLRDRLDVEREVSFNLRQEAKI